MPSVVFSGAEAIRNPARHLNQLLVPFYPGSLACGATFTCGLQETGQAFCWGDSNENGQLGTNATTGTIPPAPVAGNYTYIKLSAGSDTACGIRSDLSGWCWGLNDKGQAGAINKTQPADASLFAPTPIFGNDSWLEISLGSSFGCGIKAINRTLWCWGNTYRGALGNGVAISTALIPQQVLINGSATAVQWDKIGTGSDFACGITTIGSMYCWGDNEYGQAGTGSENISVLVPTLVPADTSGDPNPNTWVDIYIGPSSNFAFGIQSDGSSWSWGDGSEGALANDDLSVLTSPQQMLTAQTWRYIAGGGLQVLGISGGSIGYAWGTGSAGQLGAGVSINATAGPIKISEPSVAGGGGGAWSTMCANWRQSCGIQDEDTLFCWGSSEQGLLGSPGGDTSFPRQVESKAKWGVRPFAPPPAPPSPPMPPPPNNPTRPTTPPPPPPTSSSGSNVGVIVGATVGGVAAVTLILVGAMVWRRKRRQKRNSMNNNTDSSGRDAKPNAVLLWAAHSQEIESPRSALAALIPPSLAPLEFQWSDVEVIRPLGAGSFGAVYLANINHTKMAVKVLVDADAVVAATALAARTSTKHFSSTPGATGDGSGKTIDGAPSGAIATRSSKYIDTRSFAAATVPKAHIEKMLQEASLMCTLQHPNIVHLLGFCISPPCMAVEFCPRGSLYDVLATARTDPDSAKRLTWIRRLRMAKDVAAGLLHLHSRTPPILHRDVKSPNILVTADLTVKIADMGLSKLAEEAQGASKVSTMGGGANPRWLAPENLSGEKGRKEADVFAFGVVMWELLTWKLPWSEENVWVISSAVLRNERPTIPPLNELPGFDKGMTASEEVSVSKYIELMNRCWAQDPVERPDFSVIAADLGQLLQAQGAKFSKKQLV